VSRFVRARSKKERRYRHLVILSGASVLADLARRVRRADHVDGAAASNAIAAPITLAAAGETRAIM
jgi:hypothetical protein